MAALVVCTLIHTDKSEFSAAKLNADLVKAQILGVVIEFHFSEHFSYHMLSRSSLIFLDTHVFVVELGKRIEITF